MIYIVNELSHHGIKGQKWGVRRYQNEDGSLTAAGQARYGSEKSKKKHAKIETFKSGSPGLEYTRHLSTGKKSRESTAKIEINEHNRLYDDYQGAWDKFDTVGIEATSRYNKTGDLQASMDFVAEALKDYDYQFAIDIEDLQDWGERYVSFTLDVSDGKNAYRTSGDEDYSDDQFFYKKNK